MRRFISRLLVSLLLSTSLLVAEPNELISEVIQESTTVNDAMLSVLILGILGSVGGPLLLGISIIEATSQNSTSTEEGGYGAKINTEITLGVIATVFGCLLSTISLVYFILTACKNRNRAIDQRV